MPPIQSEPLTLYEGLRHLKKMKSKSWMWLFIYFGCGLLLFSIIIDFLLTHQVMIKQTILDYFFPESWQKISEYLVHYLFEMQTKTVLSNAILSGSLLIASIFLFPLKEKLSHIFERESRLYIGEYEEFSLLQQGIEEFKLILVYACAQSVILWIGYYPYEWSDYLSILLSYLFLFFTFGLDFIAPSLQRQRKTYSLIIKALLKKPLMPLVFGGILSIPLLLLSHYLFLATEYSLIEISSLLFAVNLFILSFSVLVGTILAHQIHPFVHQTIAPLKRNIILSYSFISGILAITLFLHSRVILSLHHKSQLLKAHYEIDWSSIQYEWPSLTQLTQGKALSELSFNMIMSNPTRYHIHVEDSFLYFEQKNQRIATIALKSFSLGAKQTKTIKIEIGSKTHFERLNSFSALMNDWKIDLKVDIFPGIPFIFTLNEYQ
jgi:hypothetical protein